MSSEAIERHYASYWGSPSRRASFSGPGDQTVEILKWDANVNPEGVALYATIGASFGSADDDTPSHRVEFIVGLLPEDDEVAKSLALLAMYPSTEKGSVDHGHTVTFAEPVLPGTDMRTFLILRQRRELHEILPALPLRSGIHVEFLKAIPIFPSELEFKKAHGLDGLLDRWEDAKVPFWNPKRSPSLTTA